MFDHIGIIGAGNSARALAAYLSRLGHEVTLYARRSEQVADLRHSGHITAYGIIEGTYPVTIAQSLAELAATCNIIFIATITTAYEEVAASLAPHLTSKHNLVLFSGKLCGSLLVSRVLENWNLGSLPVIETDSLFACRVQDNGSIWIRGFKNWTLYSCPQPWQTKEFGPLLNRYFPQLEPASNLLQRGLTDFGAHAHATITIANISKIDKGESFLFYYEGLSEKTVVLLEAVEEEIKAVAHAYDTSIIPMKHLLNRYYGCNTESLYKAMTTVPNYRHSVAPITLNHRYLQEDVVCTLRPLQELARKAHVEIPMIDAVIAIAMTLGQQNFSSQTRSLDKLGLNHLSHGQITSWLNMPEFSELREPQHLQMPAPQKLFHLP